MTIRIDYSNMMGDAAGGIPESQWSDAASRFTNAFESFATLRESGTVGFADIVRDQSLRDQATDYATRAKGRFDDVVVLGIGGSALGPIALRTALRPSGWNMLSDTARGGYPRLHVLDNVDPETIAALLGRLQLPRSLFIVTSKSGGTAETMSQFLIVHEALKRASLPIRAHIV
ncbi:MAG TPA: hypothetical protein VKO87_13990, partial [Gemmatimonadaceae bacterium]|nr:hypothetical protein [Gemmatimonadaceae bacterium]